MSNHIGLCYSNYENTSSNQEISLSFVIINPAGVVASEEISIMKLKTKSMPAVNSKSIAQMEICHRQINIMTQIAHVSPLWALVALQQ